MGVRRTPVRGDTVEVLGWEGTWTVYALGEDGIHLAKYGSEQRGVVPWGFAYHVHVLTTKPEQRVRVGDIVCIVGDHVNDRRYRVTAAADAGWVDLVETAPTPGDSTFSALDQSRVIIMERDGRDYFEAVDEQSPPFEAASDEKVRINVDYATGRAVRAPVRSQLLAEADRIINGDRREAYGDVTESFTRLAALWAPILGTNVTSEQVAMCLIQLKVSRLVASPQHADSWLDIAGYAALGGEVAAGS